MDPIKKRMIERAIKGFAELKEIFGPMLAAKLLKAALKDLGYSEVEADNLIKKIGVKDDSRV